MSRQIRRFAARLSEAPSDAGVAFTDSLYLSSHNSPKYNMSLPVLMEYMRKEEPLMTVKLTFNGL